MGAAAIITLLTTYGPAAIGLITTLITTAEANGTVTAAQWATLSASLSKSATDLMTARLIAAGIDPASPQGLALLAATK
jgi:uncharacterized membrane protein YebE (DUF533 family)